MNEANPEIHDVLKEFTRAAFPCVLAAMPYSQEDVKGCLWMVTTYPQTLEAVAALPAFAGDKKMADAYICGYYRGLMTAASLLQPAKPTRKKRG